MAAAGVDLRTIQEVGGWANINMLQKYVHPASQALRDAVEKVGKD
jgi:site-specific recombinase XerD